MKKLIKTIAALGMLSLFASCQMNPADDGNQNDNPASGNTTEYTVSFNLNFPDDIHRIQHLQQRKRMTDRVLRFLPLYVK